MNGGWEACLAALVEFRRPLPRPWSLEDLAAAAPGPEVVDASWRILHRVFAQPPAPPIDRATNGIVELAAMILGAVGGWGRRALDELAMANPDPGHDLVLIPLLLTITGGDDDLFFTVLHEALDGDDPGLAARAFTLMRAGYGARFSFAITKEQADALDGVVAWRSALGTNDPLLQRLLDLYVRPAVRREPAR